MIKWGPMNFVRLMNSFLICSARDRSEVTLAAGILRKAGLISYSRGKVKILDRKGFEEGFLRVLPNYRERITAYAREKKLMGQGP